MVLRPRRCSREWYIFSGAFCNLPTLFLKFTLLFLYPKELDIGLRDLYLLGNFNRVTSLALSLLWKIWDKLSCLKCPIFSASQDDKPELVGMDVIHFFFKFSIKCLKIPRISLEMQRGRSQEEKCLMDICLNPKRLQSLWWSCLWNWHW